MGALASWKNSSQTSSKRSRAQQERLRTLEAAKENALRFEADATEHVTELRLAVATERQRQENLAGQRQPMAERATELAELIAARRRDIEKYQQRIASQKQESSSAEAAIESQTAAQTAAEDAAAEIAQQRSSGLQALARSKRSYGRFGIRSIELRDLRGKEEVRQTQLQLRIDSIAENVMRRYQVDLREFETDRYAFAKTLQVQLKRRSAPAETEPASQLPKNRRPLPIDDASQLQNIIAELTRQLDNMGPVNLDAVHEYDELEERYHFLETQNNDLTAARRELLDIIARINNTTQKLFAETFAQVRTNFREMFAELFGGGRADLSLMDENDPLNCGIEIIAKPPGKQLQSISLLSGGERTMTAVALLFAIYMVRPSPFCILDEMDAPLDESNINRFIRVLDRFVSQSQFIIITHNKRTIAKADVLYGVTMEERGVSKLVGMKLADPSRPRSKTVRNRNRKRQRPSDISQLERDGRSAHFRGALELRLPSPARFGSAQKFFAPSSPSSAKIVGCFKRPAATHKATRQSRQTKNRDHTSVISKRFAGCCRRAFSRTSWPAFIAAA